MDIALFDYGVGNLHSLKKGLEAGGARVTVTSEPRQAVEADALVFPGVGAFGAAAAMLDSSRELLRETLDAGLPFLGICLGMQLLYATSEESEGYGLGVLPGRVRRLRAERIPHMGWNAVRAATDPLFAGPEGGERPGPRDVVAYFANSYVVEPEDEVDVIAWTEYGGDRFPAAVRRGRIWGVQFHPEKSGDDGLRVIRNFIRTAGS